MNVQIDRDYQIDLVLRGGTEAVVEVTASSVDQRSAEVASNFATQEIRQLPIARTYEGLLNLIPGAPASDGSGYVSVAGGTRQDNKYLVDGVNITNPGYGYLGDRDERARHRRRERQDRGDLGRVRPDDRRRRERGHEVGDERPPRNLRVEAARPRSKPTPSTRPRATSIATTGPAASASRSSRTPSSATSRRGTPPRRRAASRRRSAVSPRPSPIPMTPRSTTSGS